MIYNDKSTFQKDYQWLSNDCLLEQLKYSEPSRYEKELFSSELEVLDDNTIRDQYILDFYHRYLDKYQLQDTSWEKKLDDFMLPIMLIIPGYGIKIIIEKLNDGRYKTISRDGIDYFYFTNFPSGTQYKTIRIEREEKKVSTATEMFKEVAYSQKRFLLYAVIATVSINILALGSSFFTMQVYDRVIPTNGISTLISLIIGVAIAIFLEMILKLSRASIIDQASKNMDIEYSHKIFERFLSIRNDTLPKSVGNLSGQLQSYTNVRSFITLVSVYVFIDFPFIFMFLTVIIMLAGMKVGIVILAFLFVALTIGLLFKGKIEKLTKESSEAANQKLGFLVETVENSQKIKASDAKWNLMSKWDTLSENSIDDEIRIKRSTETSSFLSSFAQQISYVAVVGTGAYIIANTTDMTMGALIATTILSNKVFAPISQLPNLFVQWGRAKISLEHLNSVYELELDNHGISRPINHRLHSHELRCEDVKFGYYENSTVLNIPRLNIKKGEKVAILGVIGSGKSTLLKVLSGLYKPTTGKVFLDNIDMEHVSRNILSESIGYLAQENKLFSGTLRDNLSFGIVGITDERILEVSKMTGLISLISALPEGLDTAVPEGGETVSGGQKQLIAFTRMLIANNDILLLDEPTASMDEGTEKYLLKVLKNNVKDEQTLVLVTHKPALLSLVDRVIILTPQGIAMDDTKEKVLNTLQQNSLKQKTYNE